MFDFDGDGDIDQFDEELAEYELQLMEDEIIFEDSEGRRGQGGKEINNGRKSCGQVVLITLVVFVVYYLLITILGN